MFIHLLVAAALALAAQAETYAEADGWSITRHDTGCLMIREFGGAGNTIVTFAVAPADRTAPLTILVGNSGWTFPAAEDEGYQIEFSGNAAVWDDLAVRTFTTDDQGEGDRDGVISIGFAEDAIAPMLADIADASGFRLSRRA